MLQSFNGGNRVFFDGISHRDNGGELVIHGEIHRRLSLGSQALRFFNKIAEFDIALSHQFFIAEQQRFAIHLSLHTVTGDGIEIGDLPGFDTLLLG